MIRTGPYWVPPLSLPGIYSVLRDSVGSQRGRPPVTVIKGCLEVREPAALEPGLFLTWTLPRPLPVRGLLFTACLDLPSILGVGLLHTLTPGSKWKNLGSVVTWVLVLTHGLL